MQNQLMNVIVSLTFLSYFSQRNCFLELWICDKCIGIVHIMKEFYLGANC